MRKKIWELMKKDDTMLHATLQIPTINIVTLKLLKYWNFWFSVYSDLCYSLICSVDQQGTSFQQCKLDLSLTMMRVSNIHPHFVTRNQDIWIYESWKRDITLKLCGQASHKLCHAHLNVTGLMCSKFYLEDLKTVSWVWDTTFQQQPDQLIVCWQVFH